MDTKDLYEQRKDNLLRACNRQNPDYVPVMAEPGGGVMKFSGKRLNEVIDDVDAYCEAMTKFWDYVYADVVLCQGVFYYPHAQAILGKAQNHLGPDGTTLEHVQDCLMLDSDYPELIADPCHFANSTLLKRRYPELFTEDIETVKSKVKGIVDDMMNYIWGGPSKKMNEIAAERYGVVGLLSTDLPMVEHPLDVIFDYLRGFSGTLVDLRRRPEQIQEAMDCIWENFCLKFDDLSYTFPYAQQWMHVGPYMNPKQFEKLFWPYEKKLIENVHKSGNKIYVLLESKWKHLIQFFRDAPKDSVLLNADDDDVIEISKAIGDWQPIIGGLKLARAMAGSKQDNIDYAKKVLDECAGTGAFIFSCDKSWVCDCDVNQNLIDTFQWVHENGKY